MGKILLRWLSYPALVLGGSAALLLGMTSGLSYWPLGPAILALAVAAVAVLEQLAPWHPPWRTDRGDLRADVLHVLGNVLVSQTAVVAYTGLMDLRGPGLWPHEALWLQILGALLVFDLGLYAVGQDLLPEVARHPHGEPS